VSGLPTACAAYEEHLSALVDGELAGQLETAVRTHVESCPHCSAYCEGLQRVDGLLASVPAPAVPPDLRARLAARIEADAGEAVDEEIRPRRVRPVPARAPRRVRWYAQPAAVFAAAAAAAALVLFWTVRSADGPAPGEPPIPVAQIPVPVAPEAETGSLPEPSPVPLQVVETQPERVAPRPELVPEPEIDLEVISEEELALALDLETLEDLEVIANLDLLSRMLDLESEAG